MSDNTFWGVLGVLAQDSGGDQKGQVMLMRASKRCYIPIDGEMYSQ
jgi:hypothetical protein